MSWIWLAGVILVIAAALAVVTCYFYTHPARQQARLPDDLPGQHVWRTENDGVRLHAIWVDAGSEATVIYHPGYGECAGTLFTHAPGRAIWDFVRAGRARGYNFLLLDPRGEGQSNGWFGSTKRASADVAGWIAWLRAEKSQRRIQLWGVSLGAALGLAFLMGPDAESVEAAVLDSLLLSVRNTGVLPLPLALIAQIALRIVDAPELGGRLHRTAVPILFIHGQSDRITLPSNCEIAYNTLAAQGAGERVDIWLVPSAAHAEAEFYYPDEYAGRVFDWFDRWADR